MKASERRQQLLVNRELQIYLIFYAIVFGVVFVLANILADRHFEESLMLVLGGLPKTEEMDYLRETVAQMRSLKTQITTGVSLIFLAIWAIQAYYMSHRIAGPVFKATSYLKEVAEGGKRYRLAFRKHDFFTDLAESINKALPPPAQADEPDKKA